MGKHVLQHEERERHLHHQLAKLTGTFGGNLRYLCKVFYSVFHKIFKFQRARRAFRIGNTHDEFA